MKELASIDWARERPDVVELNKSFSVSEYIDNRAIYKIKLYFLLSRRSERRYKLISVAVLVLSALVPVVLNSSFLGLESGRMFLASGAVLVGAFAAFIVTILALVPFLVGFNKMFLAHPDYVADYRAAVEAAHVDKPTVFMDAAGKAWSLRPKGYDISVLFPPEQLVEGKRPAWLTLDGQRQPYAGRLMIGLWRQTGVDQGITQGGASAAKARFYRT